MDVFDRTFRWSYLYLPSSGNRPYFGVSTLDVLFYKLAIMLSFYYRLVLEKGKIKYLEIFRRREIKSGDPLK